MRPALLALVLLLAACSDDTSPVGTSEDPTADADGTTEPTAPTTTDKVTTTVPPKRSSTCEAVSAEMLAAIATGVKPQTKASLARGFAVKSTEHSKAWYIAAELDGPGLEGSGHIGIWASNSLSPGEGIIMSVDGMAKQFSDWPDGAKSDAEMRVTDKGATAAKKCF